MNYTFLIKPQRLVQGDGPSQCHWWRSKWLRLYACTLVILSVTSQLCIEAVGVSWPAPLQEIIKVTPRLLSSRFASGSERKRRSAAPAARDCAVELTDDAQNFFKQFYKDVERMRHLIPKITEATEFHRKKAEFDHKETAVGREDVAALIQSSVDEDERGVGAECIIQSGTQVTMDSAYHRGPRKYERQYAAGMFTVKDDTGKSYSACVMHQPKGVELVLEALEKAKKVLLDEVLKKDESSLRLLDSPYEKYRILTLQDILLPPGGKPFQTDSKHLYLNAIFLYPPSVAYLSYLLPLNKGLICSCPRRARQVERARLSLSHQVISIIGTIASVNEVLPRFTTASFTVTEAGVVYMTPHPQPRRSATPTLVSLYRSSLQCNLFLESMWSMADSKHRSAVDLAVVLFNIWCPIKKELIEDGPDLHSTVRLLTHPTQCYPLLPKIIRDLVAALANKQMTLSSVLQSASYKAILDRLNEE